MDIAQYTKNTSILDIVVIISHITICLGIALYHFRKVKKVEDFSTLRPSKNLVSVLVCTIFATSIGAGSTMWYIDEIYRNPIFLFYMLAQPIYWLITSKIITSGIHKIKDCTTFTQVLKKFFGRTGKTIGLYITLLDCIIAITIQFLAFGTICQYFFGINLWYGIIIGISIINAYSILGGLRGIIAIDVFQFFIFFLIIPSSYIIIINNSEHFFTSISTPVNFNIDTPVLIGLLIASLLPEMAPPFMQRYLMLSNNVKALKIVFKRLFLISIPFMFSLCLIAYIILTKFSENSNASNVIFSYITNLPIGIKGLMLAGFFSIFMSTADSNMNTSSIIIANDFIKPAFPNISSRKLLYIMRMFILLLSLSSLFLIAFKDRLFLLILIFKAIGHNIILIPLSAALLGYNVTKKQLIICLLSSIFFIILTILFNKNYLSMISLSSALGSIVGLLCNARLYRKNPIKKVSNLCIYTLHFIKELFLKIKNYHYINIVSILNKNLKSQTSNLHTFAVFILFYYFIFSLYLDNTKNFLPYLLIIGYALVLLFLLKDILFHEFLLKKYSYIYYYVCITFCLPLISSYILFYYTNTTGNNYVWIGNSLITTFLLYQFLDTTAFFISLTLGFLSGGILYMLESNTMNLEYSASFIIYIYLSFLFISQIIAKDKEKKAAAKDLLQKEKLTMIQAFAEMIAHELKTPISVTSMQASTFYIILKNIKKEKSTKKYIMDQKNYEALEKITNMLTEISKHGLNTLDNLLSSLRGSVIEEKKEVISIKQVINAAIEDSRLYNLKTENIDVICNDNFSIKYSFNCLKHVVINLIKNAYIHNKSDIKIEIETCNNRLFFKDYGKGISKNLIKKIFDKFYTESKSGTGIGLSFCKLVMEDLGGFIECQSIKGQYTKFILEFPKIKSFH